MKETLRQIAALMKTFPGIDDYPHVHFGSSAPGAVTALVTLGASPVTSLYADPPRAIDSAGIVVDGVEFRAAVGRHTTPEEQERIAHEAREIAPAVRAVSP